MSITTLVVELRDFHPKKVSKRSALASQLFVSRWPCSGSGSSQSQIRIRIRYHWLYHLHIRIVPIRIREMIDKSWVALSAIETVNSFITDRIIQHVSSSRKHDRMSGSLLHHENDHVLNWVGHFLFEVL